MRQARLKFPPDRPLGHYHCLSRVVDRRFILLDAEKEHFTRLLRECEAFCDLRVLTFCVMGNHFHLLVEVPQPPPPHLRPSPEQVCERLDALSGQQNVAAVRQRFATYRKAGDADAEAAYLATFHARMWDLSAFMKLLKQRFTLWYNARSGRKGTLWEERFKSVLVEGMGQALATVAAYIDLNPVRAGLVNDPKDYRWSGYAEAVAGRRRARLGLQRIVTALQRGRQEAPARSLDLYRTWVYREGSVQRESLDADAKPVRGALSRERVLEVLEAKGRLEVADYLRCRVRYFCDGAVLGSRGFVEELFQSNRRRFGSRRRSGARRMRGLEGGGLYTWRDLQVDVFG